MRLRDYLTCRHRRGDHTRDHSGAVARRSRRPAVPGCSAWKAS